MKDMISARELAQELGVSPMTLRRYQASGKIPKPNCVLGRRRFWNVKSLAAWLTNQEYRMKQAENAIEATRLRAEREAYAAANPHIAELHKKLGIR